MLCTHVELVQVQSVHFLVQEQFVPSQVISAESKNCGPDFLHWSILDGAEYSFALQCAPVMAPNASNTAA